MRIVYLNPTGQLGGAERMLLNLFSSLREARPEWSLHLIVSEEGPLVSRAAEHGVPATVLPMPRALARIGDAAAGGPAGKQLSRLPLLGKLIAASPSALSYVRRLRRTLRDLAPDLVHSNGLKMHLLGVRARPKTVPVIWHLHDYLSARPIMARLLRAHAAHCALMIANSRSVAEDARALFKGAADVRTIYNAIDLESFSPSGPIMDLDALARLPAAPPETVRVGMLSTMARWKGQETFLRALSLIQTDLPVRGYIISGALYRTAGSQYTFEELTDMVQRLGLAGRVGLTGFVEHPARVMRALDIIVHASTQPEPFGLVIAEGMACGRAVVASHAGGAAELIEADVDALGHSPGDAPALASRIIELVNKPELRQRLGNAGRATAERLFDHKRLAGELIPLYREAVERISK